MSAPTEVKKACECGVALEPWSTPASDGHLYCCDCWNRQVDERKAKRKAQLASEPRCEADGCRARGAWRVGGHTLLCKRHLKAAMANRVKAAGPLAIIWWAEQTATDRASILRFANGEGGQS